MNTGKCSILKKGKHGRPTLSNDLYSTCKSTSTQLQCSTVYEKSVHKILVSFRYSGELAPLKPDDGGGQLPNCLLIGVRKGGTRALIEMMGLHSKVHIARDEIHFFDNDENYKKVSPYHLSQKLASSHLFFSLKFPSVIAPCLVWQNMLLSELYQSSIKVQVQSFRMH